MKRLLIAFALLLLQPFILSTAVASPGCTGCERKTLRAKDNFDDGNYPAAEQDLLEVVQTFESESDPGREAAPYSVALQNLALIYYFEGKLDDATAVFSKALPFTQSVWGDNSLPVADNLHKIARTLRRAEKFDEAEPILKRVIELRSKSLASDHPLLANAYMDLAVNYQRQKRMPEAEEIYNKVIHAQESPGHAQKLLGTLLTYEHFLQISNAPQEAMAKLQDRIEQLKQNIAADTSPKSEPLATEKQSLSIRLLPSINDETQNGAQDRSIERGSTAEH